MTILEHPPVSTPIEEVGVLRSDHVDDIDALKQIVIGLTARVNELEFAARRGALYTPGPFFRNSQK